MRFIVHQPLALEMVITALRNQSNYRKGKDTLYQNHLLIEFEQTINHGIIGLLNRMKEHIALIYVILPRP
jgi:hypothetical protein